MLSCSSGSRLEDDGKEDLAGKRAERLCGFGWDTGWKRDLMLYQPMFMTLTYM